MVRHLSVLKVYCYVLIIMTCISTILHGVEARVGSDKSNVIKFMIAKHSDRRLQKYLRNYKIHSDQSYYSKEKFLHGYTSPTMVQNPAAKDQDDEVYSITITRVDDEEKPKEVKPIKEDRPIKEGKLIHDAKATETDKPIHEGKTILETKQSNEAKTISGPKSIHDAKAINEAKLIHDEKTINEAKSIHDAKTFNEAKSIHGVKPMQDAKLNYEVKPDHEVKRIHEDKTNNGDKMIHEDKHAKQNVLNNEMCKPRDEPAKVSKRAPAVKGKKLGASLIKEKYGSHLYQPGTKLGYLERKLKNLTEKRRWWWNSKTTRDQENSVDEETTHENSTCEEHRTLRMETLLVVDRPLVDLFETPEAARDYVLAAFTTARNLFLEPSLGQAISLVIVRMIVVEHSTVELSLSLNRDLRGTLSEFSRFQHKVNPSLETHPNHHDMSVLVTRAPLCESEETCGIRAAAYRGGACNSFKQAAIVIDTGLGDLGHSIAHAIAIALGIEHDVKRDDTCRGPGGDKATVMHQGGSTGMRWSPASRESLKKFLANRGGECLEDAPADHSIKEDELLAGVTYSGDEQCRALLGTRKTKACSMGLTCTSLNCMVHGLSCVETNVPPAFGTPCAERSWCWMKNCLPEGERPGAVDGQWGPWGPWGACSRNCGSGVAVSERECNNPPPSTGGKICLGPGRRHVICNTHICPEDHPLFRDTQCAAFNNWEFPEDRQKHNWKAFFDHEESPCSLVCKNEKGNVALLKPHVTDGTPCIRGSSDVCVGGECQHIPCDLNMSSEAIEDACGVCHGDGTQCTVKSGVVDIEEQRGEGSLVLVVTVPKGSRNIRVMEMEPSESSLVIHGAGPGAGEGSEKSDKKPKAYTDGQKLGMFTVPGSEAWVGTVKPLQELLLIPGPVTEELYIKARPKQHVSFYYSIAKEAEKRKGVYSWDFLEWGPCSATCGLGTERAVPHCMEHETGLVEPKHCSHLQKPEDKTRECVITPCTPRWVIGDWQACEATSDHEVCERTRSVWCMRPMGQADDSMTLLDPDECGDVGPRTAEECSCRGVPEKQEPSADDSQAVIVDRKSPDDVSVVLLMGKAPNFKRRKLSGFDALRFLEVQCEGDASLCESE